MSTPLTRRFVLTTSTSLLATTACAAPPRESVRPQMRGPNAPSVVMPEAAAIVDAAGLGGRVSFAVAEAATGKLLEARGVQVATPPASVTKAITALYALDTLGAEYRFRTRVVATGPVSNGVVQGDLVLVGGGDPTLDTNGLAALAAKLKAAGISEVRGGFKVADGALPRVETIDPKQPPHVGYSPAISGIALNFNRVYFEWKRQGGGYAVSMDARSDRLRPVAYTSTMRVVDRRLPVYGYSSSDGKDNWSVARAALGKGGSRWLPVRNPALYAGDVFQTLARSQGIVLKAPAVTRSAPGGTELAAVQSEPLREVLRGMLRYSTNLTAEMVGLLASQRRTGQAPRALKASAEEMSRWAVSKLGAAGIKLEDHSGLGSGSRMTAEGMLAALLAARKEGELRSILKRIPMLDERRQEIKNHPVTVRAKTGTLNFVSCLAGYMTRQGGPELAFVIFTINDAKRRGIARADREAPAGARMWNRRSKAMQQKLIERWGAVFSG